MDYKFEEKEAELIKRFNKVTGYISRNYTLRRQPLTWDEYSELTDFFEKLKNHWLMLNMEVTSTQFRNMDSQAFRKEAFLGELIKEVESMKKRERRRDRERPAKS